MESLGIDSVKTETFEAPAAKQQTDPADVDLYTRYVKLKKQIQFLDVQEEYIKDEMRNLRKVFKVKMIIIKTYLGIPSRSGRSEAHSVNSSRHRPVLGSY